MRRAFVALVLAGGLAAVFATASQTAHRPVGNSLDAGLALDYGPADQIHVQQASCTLSSTKGVGGGALCTTPTGTSLPRTLASTLRQSLQARTGRSLLPCTHPFALARSLGEGRYVITCLAPGTHKASFVFRSHDGSPTVEVGTASTVTLVSR